METDIDTNSQHRAVSVTGEEHRALKAVREEASGLERGGQGRLPGGG